MEVPRIAKDQLKSLMSDPNLTIIDVRRQKEKRKIQNAILEEADQVASWMGRYPKDKKLVLYCA